ncbi:unnamed protein product [Ambrosiozyma monospora]|uniref:Unnamed protein product n=1 Tax=Ambrosiozyma monospora TaxID=43982 RepID=A0A9W6YNK6_AMBMO|nr:unnamed protein product [Ambrosiozyma monospora]
MPTPIPVASQTVSSKNVQKSFSYLDFCPTVTEDTHHKKRRQAWNHICRWFHIKNKKSTDSTAHREAQEVKTESINSSFGGSESESEILNDSTFVSPGTSALFERDKVSSSSGSSSVTLYNLNDN